MAQPRFPFAALLAAVALPLAPVAAADRAPTRERPPALQLPTDVRPTRYAIEVTIDPKADGFEGTEVIQATLDRPRRELWLHGRDLAVRSAAVELAGGERVAARWEQVDPSGLAHLVLPRALGPGPVSIHLGWTGRWGELVGLYRSTEGADAYAVTQFEPIDARRAFPCFDEPAFKTPFEVTLVVPERDVAVANAPDTGSEPAGAGRKRVRFAATKPLPTYLVFWGVGPFDVVTPPPLPPNGVRTVPLPVRGLAPRGRGPELATGLGYAAEAVAALESWFGIPYPYEKLDHVAVPEFAYGAMENAGAISYAEPLFLSSPASASDVTRRNAAVTIAHELAHHWFGDFVTLRWWTDTWLNESFATWLSFRIVDRTHPEWALRPWAVTALEGALEQDGYPTSRAIRQPLQSMDAVGQQFDALSYQKGAAVLFMFERFVGEDRFRDGVRSYLAARPHGTGDTAALLEAISKAAGRDVAGPFATFLDRPGVPFVQARVECDASGARARLTQSPWAPRGVKPSDGRWGVPVCARYEAGGAAHERCTLLDGAEAILALPEGCPAWFLPDAGGASYARWALAPADLAKLRGALTRLEAPERVRVATNLAAVERAGRMPFGDLMDVVTMLARDPDPQVVAATLPVFEHARAAILPAAAMPALEAVARRLYRPVLDGLGWEDRRDESAATRDLRGHLVEFLVRTARDPDVLREAARRGRAYAGVDDGQLHTDAAAPEVAGPALMAAVLAGGAPVFDALLARLGTVDDAIVRRRMYLALAAVEAPPLADRALALVHDGPLRRDERLWVLAHLAAAPATRGRVLEVVARDADRLLASLPPPALEDTPALFDANCDAAAAARVEALFRPLVAKQPGLARPVARSAQRIRACAAERSADANAMARWFRGHATPGAPPGPR